MSSTTTLPPRLWKNHRYVLWLTSDTAKGLGTSLFSFAIPLVALFVTDDPAQAGIIGGVGMAVRLVITLYGGVLADRHDRIRMMLLGAAVGAVLGGAFLLLAVADALTFASLMLVEVLMCIRAGTFEPSSESALKEIVPDEAMGRAQAANQGRDAALQLAGGPLGGVLLAAGAWLIGLAMAVSYAVSAVTAWLLLRSTRRPAVSSDADERGSGEEVPGSGIGGMAGELDLDGGAAQATGATHVVSPAEATANSETAGGTASDSVGEATDAADSAAVRRNAMREIREGFVWLFSRPDLSGVLLIVTVINLGFNAAVTTVVYGLQQDGYSAVLIGAISAAFGGVMLVGALIAPALVPRVRAGTLMITGLGVATACAALLALAEQPWAIIVVLGLAVFPLPALNAAMMGYFMVATPTRLLGRANSAAGVLGMGAMPLGPLIAGFGLSLVGRESTILFCAGLCAVSLLMAVFNKPLRSLPTEAGWAAHAAQFGVSAPVPASTR